MKRNAILVLMLLTFAGCTKTVASQVSKSNVATPTITTEALPAQVKPAPITLANTLGVVVLSNNYRENDFIQIYNEDGSLWHRFTFYYDDSDCDFEYDNEDFRPLAFHLDYFLLVLKCVRKIDGRYEVIVNKETKLKKYVRADDSTMKFETWEEHIVNVISVSFNQDENPLLEVPGGQPIIKKFFDKPRFISKEVKGNWLRVQWLRNEPLTNEAAIYDSGWVKWKKDGILLIELEYIC
jgi:hypothetical protein